MGNDLLFEIEAKLEAIGVAEPFTTAHEIMHIIASNQTPKEGK